MLGLIILLQALTLAVSGPATSPEYLPIWVADGDGHFAREGLRVAVRTTRSEVGAAEARGGGEGGGGAVAGARGFLREADAGEILVSRELDEAAQVGAVEVFPSEAKEQAVEGVGGRHAGR